LVSIKGVVGVKASEGCKEGAKIVLKRFKGKARRWRKLTKKSDNTSNQGGKSNQARQR